MDMKFDKLGNVNREIWHAAVKELQDLTEQLNNTNNGIGNLMKLESISISILFIHRPSGTVLNWLAEDHIIIKCKGKVRSRSYHSDLCCAIML